MHSEAQLILFYCSLCTDVWFMTKYTTLLQVASGKCPRLDADENMKTLAQTMQTLQNEMDD